MSKRRDTFWTNSKKGLVKESIQASIPVLASSIELLLPLFLCFKESAFHDEV